MSPHTRRVLVVGGSSGIGRSVAVALGRRGDRVVVAARRAALVEAVAAEAGPTATGLVVDATDADRVHDLVAGAVRALGGLDTVVYAAGSSPLAPLADTGATAWHDVLATNVVGAGLVVAAATDHLRAGADPTAVLLTSHSVGRPWPGLVPYAASKAALDELVLGLRAEEPWLRVVRVVVGPTSTPFADRWDPADAESYFVRWADEGYLAHQVLGPDEVATRLLAALDDPASPDDVRAVGATGG